MPLSFRVTSSSTSCTADSTPYTVIERKMHVKSCKYTLNFHMNSKVVHIEHLLDYFSECAA